MITPPSKDRSLGTPLITPPSKDRSLGTPMITPSSKGRSLGTPMTPDFAQDGERKTSNGKNNDKSRFLASLGMTNKDAAE
jgi:hypothetical protein